MDERTEHPAAGGMGVKEHAAGQAVVPVRHDLQFTGRAGEYFSIWIVNIVLSILTLGIYSAWAKVRTERYFYGNTRLAGSSFEYLADPIRILKGRLVAYALVIVFYLSYQFLPVLYLGLAFVVFLCTPLLVFLTLRFRARYSAWRGIRFRFVRTAGSAYGPFMGWVLLSGITLGLLYPLMVLRQHDYIVGGHRLGRAGFSFRGDAGHYFIPFLIAMGIGTVLFGVAFTGMFIAFAAGGASQGDPGKLAVFMIPMMVLLYAGMALLIVYLRVRYVNLMWNSSTLDDNGFRFESTLRVRDVLWLYASNLVVVLCTLGLAVPWAMVRLARYRAERLVVLANKRLDGFVVDQEAERSAAGAEAVDAFDIGVDIGI